MQKHATHVRAQRTHLLRACFCIDSSIIQFCPTTYQRSFVCLNAMLPPLNKKVAASVQSSSQSSRIFLRELTIANRI